MKMAEMWATFPSTPGAQRVFETSLHAIQNIRFPSVLKNVKNTIYKTRTEFWSGKKWV
jgi:hypothetical protein